MQKTHFFHQQKLDKLFERRTYWKRKRNKCLQRIYHNSVSPWIIAGIGSLIWLFMGWGVLASWIFILIAISSAFWSSYWIIKFNEYSKKIDLIDEIISQELVNEGLLSLTY